MGRRFYDEDIAWPFCLHDTGAYSKFTGFFPHPLHNGGRTVTVQGKFSTGAVAAMVKVRFEDEKGKVLWKEKTNADGECTSTV